MRIGWLRPAALLLLVVVAGCDALSEPPKREANPGAVGVTTDLDPMATPPAKPK